MSALRAARTLLAVAGFAVHGPFLTGLSGVVPPRVGHGVARVLGVSAALSMFCVGPCCPEVPLWADAEAVAAS